MFAFEIILNGVYHCSKHVIIALDDLLYLSQQPYAHLFLFP